MRSAPEVLTDYVIKNGLVDETDREVYKYGFTISIELGLFIVFSLSVTLYLHMILEGLLFFVIFAPLRSYAGGLHLGKFHSCFILSAFTFLGMLLIVKNIDVSIIVLFIIFLILELCVYVLYPVENINRKVDNDEDRYFKRRLKKCLLANLAIVGICASFKCNRYLLVITITYLMVVVTMVIGKCKNAIDNVN